MKIFSINNLKTPILTGCLLFATQSLTAQSLQHDPQLNRDLFVKKDSLVSPKGNNEPYILREAPSPWLEVQGELKSARIVVDLSKNILYKYNELAEPEMAYLIASGKKSTPTNTGVRIVTNIEKWPYKTAGLATKRRKNPNDYGPRAIIVQKLNPITGEKSSTGEFIHGNNNPKSLGKYASKGCIRMDNQVIRELAKQIKKGDLVIIKRSEDKYATCFK